MSVEGPTRPGAPPPAPEFRRGPEEEMPRFQLTRRHMLWLAFFTVSVVAFLYFVLPKLTGLDDTWNRLDEGDPWWLAAALAFEIASFAGYVILFRAVFVLGASHIDWRESYQITMSGLAATRLFAAAGAGGVALTAWALRRSGMEARQVASRMVAFLVLLYAVYMLALLVGGLGLRTGAFPGPDPFGITVIPAIFALAVITIVLGLALVPTDLERRLGDWSRGTSRRARLARRMAAVPAAIAAGVREALTLARAREWGIVGAPLWWGFDIAVLWACFNAFGAAPEAAVIVVAYFVGMLGNTLPLPGGIGGVDGGMIGAFAAFGVDFGLATVAVLTYRGFAFWLPTIPGVIAYLQLRRTVSRWRDVEPASA